MTTKTPNMSNPPTGSLKVTVIGMGLILVAVPAEEEMVTEGEVLSAAAAESSSPSHPERMKTVRIVNRIKAGNFPTRIIPNFFIVMM